MTPVVAILAETWARSVEPETGESFRPPSPSDRRQLQQIVRALGVDVTVACMSVYVDRFRQNFDVSPYPSGDYDPVYTRLRSRFRGFFREINLLHRQVRQTNAWQGAEVWTTSQPEAHVA